MSDTPTILPVRVGETDTERRLREAINRHGGQMLSVLDAALALRSAPDQAQRARHKARGYMIDFALNAMHAIALKEEPPETICKKERS